MKIITPIENKKSLQKDFLINHNFIKGLTNEELRLLIKEFEKIGKADRPNLVRQSKMMKFLFENSICDSYFFDKYCDVKTTVEKEILTRFKNKEI